MSVDIAGADRSQRKKMKAELSASTVAFISCKATVLAESSIFILLHRDLSAPVMSTDMSQVGVTPFFILIYVL